MEFDVWSGCSHLQLQPCVPRKGSQRLQQFVSGEEDQWEIKGNTCDNTDYLQGQGYGDLGLGNTLTERE